MCSEKPFIVSGEFLYGRSYEGSIMYARIAAILGQDRDRSIFIDVRQLFRGEVEVLLASTVFGALPQKAPTHLSGTLSAGVLADNLFRRKRRTSVCYENLV